MNDSQKEEIIMSTVENLKKVKLSFKAGTSAETMDLTPKYPDFEFIFGIGQAGISPFEIALSNKKVGEEVTTLLQKSDFQRFFNHLYPPILDLFDGRDELYLTANVISVTEADNREVVKALAATAAGCGGGCGCGCDGH